LQNSLFWINNNQISIFKPDIDKSIKTYFSVSL